MSRWVALIVGCSLLVSSQGFAALGGVPKSSFNRGGVGFLFNDNNSFNNVSSQSGSHGAAFEVQYGYGSNVSAAQTSLVWGNGTVGLGAYGNRTGVSLTQASRNVDTVGVGASVALSKERFHVGAKFERPINVRTSNSGIAEGSFTLMNAKGMGFGLGGSYSSQLASETGANLQVLKVSLGYSFRPNSGMEAIARINDMMNTLNWTAGGSINYADNIFFIGAGYEYTNIGAISTVIARFGFIIGKHFDISVLGNYSLVSGSNPFVGGSARLSF